VKRLFADVLDADQLEALADVLDTLRTHLDSPEGDRS